MTNYPSAASQAVLILGMHRSGTSCLAGSLREAGLDVLQTWIQILYKVSVIIKFYINLLTFISTWECTKIESENDYIIIFQ